VVTQITVPPFTCDILFHLDQEFTSIHPPTPLITSMTQLPTPDDGLGLIGAIRTFVLDGIEWRAFEYQSPVTPSSQLVLILVSATSHYQIPDCPRHWRTMPPEELIGMLAWRS
jgi:hypothetical protein